jgi:hypothetical protein
MFSDIPASDLCSVEIYIIEWLYDAGVPIFLNISDKICDYEKSLA